MLRIYFKQFLIVLRSHSGWNFIVLHMNVSTLIWMRLENGGLCFQ